MPAYNEGENIGDCLRDLKKTLAALPDKHEIIVVDDGSGDDTFNKACEAGARVVQHKTNMGYGRSLKDGISAASGEYIFLIDADGTYDMGKIPKMISMAGDADLVVGKRVFSAASSHHIKNIARRFFAYQVSYYANTKIEDLNSGQRIFRRQDVIDSLDRYPDGFSFTSTQTVFYCLHNKRIVYTPVEYRHRGAGSKFLSRVNVMAMAKLSFRLTLFGRPLLLFAQLLGVIAAAAAISKMIGDSHGANAYYYIDSFIIFVPVLFFILLCYIYARGRAVVVRN